MSDEIKNEQQPQVNNVDDNDPSAETKKPESNKEHVDNKVPYDRFKAKVDETNALKEELAKLREAQEAAERAQLEEQNEYKKLYEKTQSQLEALKAEALNAKKDALLVKAGYDDEQAKVLRNTLKGETDEELTQAIEELRAVFPPKQHHVDPSPMNGTKHKPEPVDPGEAGAKVFERIKNKIF